MPRRYHPPRRPVTPDQRYNSEMLGRFINKFMRQGKKSLATRIMYQVIATIEERLNRPGVEVVEEALRNVAPIIEVRPRRVGGSTYQIPVEVPPHRQLSLAIRWLLAAARQRSGHSMADKLAAEFMDAANKTGSAIKKREDTHRMAEANRAFAHYRW